MTLSDKVLTNVISIAFQTLSEAFPQIKEKSKVTSHYLLHKVPGTFWKSEGKSISRTD